jgi:hypothetical protein
MSSVCAQVSLCLESFFLKSQFQIVDKICSSTTAAELLKLRLVNSLFYRQSTRRYSKINHKPVFLGNKSSIVENFLRLMKTRFDPKEINLFPFSSYALDPRQSASTIENFAAEVGQHVRRLHFTFTRPFSSNDKRISDHQFPQTLVSILSRAPKLTEIALMSYHPIQMAYFDLPDLPLLFKIQNSWFLRPTVSARTQTALSPRLFEPEPLQVSSCVVYFLGHSFFEKITNSSLFTFCSTVAPPQADVRSSCFVLCAMHHTESLLVDSSSMTLGTNGSQPNAQFF